MSKILEVSGVTKKYGGLIAVNNVSFDVNVGEILSVNQLCLNLYLLLSEQRLAKCYFKVKKYQILRHMLWHERVWYEPFRKRQFFDP